MSWWRWGTHPSRRRRRVPLVDRPLRAQRGVPTWRSDHVRDVSAQRRTVAVRGGGHLSATDGTAPPPVLAPPDPPAPPPPRTSNPSPQGVLDFPSSGFVLCSFLPRLVHGFPEQAPPLRMEIHVRRAGELHRSGMTHKRKNWSDPDTDALKPPPSAPRQMCPMLPYPSCAPKTSPHPLEAAAKPHEHTASTPRQHPRLVSGPCHPKCAAPARHLGRCTTRRRGWLATVAATRHRRSCRRQACHPPQRSKRRARR